MSTPFQNRLVGTVIVAAVLIIFLPDILDGKKSEYQAEFDPIPEAPSIQKTQTEKSFPSKKLNALYTEPTYEEPAMDDELAVVKNASAESSSQKSSNKNTQSSALAKQKSITSQASKKTVSKLPDKALAQTAWVVQLGSFRHTKNVEDLVSKLKKSGYTAFTKPIKTKNGTLTKVFVGPELIKRKLEEKLPHLKSLTGMQGKLAHFTASK